MKLKHRAFFVVAIILLVAVCWKIYTIQQFMAKANVAEGTVIDLHEQHGDGTTYLPVFRYITEAGDTVTFEGGTGSNPPAWAIGEKARILYSADDIHNARAESLTELYFTPGMLSILCIALFIVAFRYYAEYRSIM